jgi:hypothetical protein
MATEYEDDEMEMDAEAVSPLQMLMMSGFSTVTPEGKAKAAEIFDTLYGKRSQHDQDEQAAYDEYEVQAQAARETLRKAREILAAKKTPSTRYLEMARGFGAPTRAGSFAESISNYAGERIPGRQRESEWEQNRDNQLMTLDQGLGTFDQQLALQKLKLRQARRAADDKLMLESMKIMGRPTPQGRNPPKTAERVTQEALDKAYVKDYIDFITQGASTAQGDIQALGAAERALRGVKLDPKTGQEIPGVKSDTISGPVIGIFPKIIRDIFTPRGSATQEDVESVAQKALKTVLGPQFTANEGERFLARVYNPRFEEPVNARRVARLLTQIKRAHAEKSRAAQYFQEHGTLKGYQGRIAWDLSMFDPDIPEGASPMDVIEQEARSLTGSAPPAPAAAAAPPAPDEGMEEIPIESLLPAGMAKGGSVQKFADGGKVAVLTKVLAGSKATANSLLRKLKAYASAHDYPLHESDLYRYAAKLQKTADDSNMTPEQALEQMLEYQTPFSDFDEYLVDDKLFNQLYFAGKDPSPAGFAEGGPVEGEFPDGRPRYRMPDGKVIKARPGDTYEFALEMYTRATGTAPTRPGLPPQQLPPRDPVAEQPEMTAPAPAPIPPAAAPPMQEEDPSYAERVVEELPGSMAAAGAGAIGAGATEKFLTAMSDRMFPGRRETRAQRRVLDMMSERQRTPADIVADVRRQQRMGIPAMAMDDPALRGTADAVLPESGMANATEILSRLKARQEGVGERVMDRINQGLKPDEYFGELDKLKENLYKDSEPLYQKAYAAHPGIKSKVLAKLLNTPDGKKAVKSALRVMRNKGQKIGKQDAMNMVSAPSLEFLDRVKRGLDDLITKEEGHGINYKATDLGSSIRALRNALRDELDAATTPAKGESLYKKAREQYAGDLEVLDALQKGRDEFSRLQPQELSKLVKKMSFAEKDAYRTGVAQQLFETIESPATDINAARKVIGSPAMRKKLRQLFDTDKQYQLFETALQRESELYEQSKKTINRAEAGQELHVAPREDYIKRGARYVPRLGWKSPVMWALQFIRNNQRATEEKMDDVLKHMKASTPEELADLEKTLGPKYSRRIKRKGRAGKAAVAGAAGAAAYNVLTDEPNEDEDDAE